MDKLDPVIAVTALVALLTGNELAQVVGPYAVILLGATTGAGWSLGRQEVMSRAASLLYFAKMNFTALLVTVPLAAMATEVFKLQDQDWLLVPISLLVGGIGNDWPRVGRWIINRLGRLIERRIDGVSGTDSRDKGDWM